MRLVVACLIAIALAGCVTSPEPAAPVGLEARDASGSDEGVPLGLRLLASTEDLGVTDGAGIAVWGDLAFVGGYIPPTLWIVDIADPAHPQIISTMPDVPVRDAGVFETEDGRVILATASGNDHIHLVDVTDPYDPEYVSAFQTASGNHNLAVVPGHPVIYNSVSSGSDTDIWDVSNPYLPILVQDWNNGAGCHDISFFSDPAEGKFRAYCAGIDEVQIWDIEDPRFPKVLVALPFPAFGVEGAPAVAPVSFAHLAMVNHDASVLILGDETGGGLANGCDLYVEAGGQTHSGPAGNLYFYDLRNEKAPVLHGQLSPNIYEGGISCTAHFGTTIDDTDHLVMGFYNAGVLLVDFRDLDNPRIVDRWSGSGSVWDAQHRDGYVFTGDRDRGLDVLSLA